MVVILTHFNILLISGSVFSNYVSYLKQIHFHLFVGMQQVQIKSIVVF